MSYNFHDFISQISQHRWSLEKEWAFSQNEVVTGQHTLVTSINLGVVPYICHTISMIYSAEELRCVFDDV